jgi:transposase
MAGKRGQKKLVWSDEEKLSICAQSRVPGVSIAQVARRYAMNTNLIHKWLRDPRFAPGDAVVDLVCAEQARFLPIEVAGVMSAPVTNVPPSLSSGPVTVQRIDITLSDGRRILVEGATALSAVVALVTGLSQ